MKINDNTKTYAAYILRMTIAYSNVHVIKSLFVYAQYKYIPVFGQSKHCPGEAYDTADNSKQHCSKDIKLLPNDSPSQ